MPSSLSAFRRPRLPRWLKLLSFRPAVSVLNAPLNAVPVPPVVVGLVVVVSDPPPPPHAARPRTREAATRPARRLTGRAYKNEGAPCGAPSRDLIRSSALERRRNLDLAGDDLRLLGVHRGDERGRHLLADLADVLALALQVEDEVVTRAELALSGELVERADGRVDALHARRQDVRAEVGLVGVDADAPDLGRLRSLQGAEAAAAGDLEDRLRALRDVLERDLLALRRGGRREVVRVVDQDLGGLVVRLGTGAV